MKTITRQAAGHAPARSTARPSGRAHGARTSLQSDTPARTARPSNAETPARPIPDAPLRRNTARSNQNTSAASHKPARARVPVSLPATPFGCSAVVSLTESGLRVDLRIPPPTPLPGTAAARQRAELLRRLTAAFGPLLADLIVSGQIVEDPTFWRRRFA